MNIILMLSIIFILMSLRKIIGLMIFYLPLKFYNLKVKKYKTIENQRYKELGFVPLEINKTIKTKALLINFLNGLNRYWDFECGKLPSHRIRNFMYKNIWLINMGKKSVIYWGAEIRAGYNLIIGEGSIIGDNSLLDARNNITIGKNVNFSSKVSIYTEDHDHRDPYFRGNTNSSYRVKIDDRAWIGPNVIILHSVHIGEGAVVAAGSVVTKDIAPFSIVAGIPAKVIGERNHDLRYIFDGTYLPFY